MCPRAIHFQHFPYKKRYLAQTESLLGPLSGCKPPVENRCHSAAHRSQRTNHGCPTAFISISTLHTENVYQSEREASLQNASTAGIIQDDKRLVFGGETEQPLVLAGGDRTSAQTMFTSTVQAAVEVGLTLRPKTNKHEIWTPTNQSLIQGLKWNENRLECLWS